jgi:hypothetical protein
LSWYFRGKNPSGGIPSAFLNHELIVDIGQCINFKHKMSIIFSVKIQEIFLENTTMKVFLGHNKAWHNTGKLLLKMVKE